MAWLYPYPADKCKLWLVFSLSRWQWAFLCLFQCLWRQSRWALGCVCLQADLPECCASWCSSSRVGTPVPRVLCGSWPATPLSGARTSDVRGVSLSFELPEYQCCIFSVVRSHFFSANCVFRGSVHFLVNAVLPLSYWFLGELIHCGCWLC